MPWALVAQNESISQLSSPSVNATRTPSIVSGSDHYGFLDSARQQPSPVQSLQSRAAKRAQRRKKRKDQQLQVSQGGDSACDPVGERTGKRNAEAQPAEFREMKRQRSEDTVQLTESLNDEPGPKTPSAVEAIPAPNVSEQGRAEVATLPLASRSSTVQRAVYPVVEVFATPSTKRTTAPERGLSSGEHSVFSTEELDVRRDILTPSVTRIIKPSTETSLMTPSPTKKRMVTYGQRSGTRPSHSTRAMAREDQLLDITPQSELNEERERERIAAPDSGQHDLDSAVSEDMSDDLSDEEEPGKAVVQSTNVRLKTDVEVPASNPSHITSRYHESDIQPTSSRVSASNSDGEDSDDSLASVDRTRTANTLDKSTSKDADADSEESSSTSESSDESSSSSSSSSSASSASGSHQRPSRSFAELAADNLASSGPHSEVPAQATGIQQIGLTEDKFPIMSPLNGSPRPSLGVRFSSLSNLHRESMRHRDDLTKLSMSPGRVFGATTNQPDADSTQLASSSDGDDEETSSSDTDSSADEAENHHIPADKRARGVAAQKPITKKRASAGFRALAA
ncbi:hypothetical protein PYCC9005_004861 [Savitreella phatthalungensis]